MTAADWTIMVFLNGDNNLEPQGLVDYREMAAIGSNESINLIVQFDRNGSFAATNPQWHGAYRFRVEQGVMATPAVAVEALGNTNMGSGITLRNFVDWSMERYPARRYMLIIWNHGQGWRFFRAAPPTITGIELHQYRNFRIRQLNAEAERRSGALRLLCGRDEPNLVATPAIPIGLAVPGTVRSVSSDDTSNDFLYNREMQDSLAGLSIDIVGFDACLMAMVETAYALRGTAKIMVGSEELEPGTGWDYTDWLRVLAANPEMDAADLSKVLVESYERTYSNNYEATTLSAVDLGKTEQLASCVDDFAEDLLALSAADFRGILHARSECAVYAPGYGLNGIDLGRFADRAGATVPGVGATAAAVRGAIDEAVIANYASDNRRGEFGSNGLAIYFPENKATFQADPDREGYSRSNSNFPVEFVQNHKWADFLVDRYLPST